MPTYAAREADLCAVVDGDDGKEILFESAFAEKGVMLSEVDGEWDWQDGQPDGRERAPW